MLAPEDAGLGTKVLLRRRQQRQTDTISPFDPLDEDAVNFLLAAN